MLNLPANKPLITWILLVSGCLLALTVWLVFFDRNNLPDEKVFAAIEPVRTDGLTAFMNFITVMGNHKFLVPANLVLIAVLLITRNRVAAATAAFTALSSLGLMSLLKNLLARQRPTAPLVDGITNFGFPSGHAFMSVAFYGMLLLIAYKGIRGPLLKYAVILFLVLLVLLIGFSRIYLRVHYATDVVAGYCIGASWLIGCLWLANEWEERRKSIRVYK